MDKKEPDYIIYKHCQNLKLLKSKKYIKTTGEKIGWVTFLLCTAFFLYLFACGLINIQPFTTHGYEVAQNVTCGEQLQRAGYCCRSEAQFLTGDCTK